LSPGRRTGYHPVFPPHHKGPYPSFARVVVKHKPPVLHMPFKTWSCFQRVPYCVRRAVIDTYRQSFPNDETAVKLIFTGLKNISKKWTTPMRDWGAALNQFAIIYGEKRTPMIYRLHKNIHKLLHSQPIHLCVPHHLISHLDV
jgi:hypothetical protein